MARRYSDPASRENIHTRMWRTRFLLSTPGCGVKYSGMVWSVYRGRSCRYRDSTSLNSSQLLSTPPHPSECHNSSTSQHLNLFQHLSTSHHLHTPRHMQRLKISQQLSTHPHLSTHTLSLSISLLLNIFLHISTSHHLHTPRQIQRLTPLSTSLNSSTSQHLSTSHNISSSLHISIPPKKLLACGASTPRSFLHAELRPQEASCMRGFDPKKLLACGASTPRSFLHVGFQPRYPSFV